jgi:DNA invertase Pin-like site-specific DNA recombinase
MIYGYIRVSTVKQANEGNSLEGQTKLLLENGVSKENIYQDAYTGTKADRPQFNKLLNELKEGDTLVVTKLDRFARSMIEGSKIVNDLIEKGVKVNVLNIGLMDNTPASKLIRNIFFSFAEFERDMIVERTLEGKQIKMETDVDATLGRPKKFKKAQRDMALQLLEKHSYNEVANMTGISRRTLIRYKKENDLKLLKTECEGK